MAKLTIEDLINKKELVKAQGQIQKAEIFCKKLGGEIEVHGLSKNDLADVREKMKKDYKQGTYYMIYLSADILREEQLLEAYGCKTDSIRIVERLFPHENEIIAITKVIEDLNGLGYLSPDEIYRKEIEDLKN
nr:MAG TPA: tail assembly chaperone protein [Caudoviricetes sp.]